MIRITKLKNKLVFVTCFVFMIMFTSSFKNTINKTKVEPIKYEVHTHDFVERVDRKKYKGGLKDYMKVVADRESNSRVDIVNKQGMMGKYQFSPATLKDHGIFDHDEFLSNEFLQDSIMILNLKKNARRLGKTIRQYSNKWMVIGNDSVFITKSGILAGAHLVGPGGVLSYFYPDKHNHPTHDANGTTITRYMNLFGNYQLGGI